MGGVSTGHVLDDRYDFVRKLGSGGNADVYLADDRLLGRQVAVKVLSSRFAGDEQFVERFRREASSAASLNHPNIVQIYDRGEAEGTYYIAMEYLEGRSLKEIIIEHAPLSPDLLTSISVQILEALRVAHSHDVIHRDIKPQNIIVLKDGRLKVTDFGIARAGSASAMTEVGSILGTAHYLSPEQAQGQPVEAASDLYSLGVVMYEMATGKLPFEGDNPLSIATQHVHEQPVAPRSLVPRISEDLEAIILRSLQKLPAERYATAQAMLDDIKRLQAGGSAAAQPTQVRRRPPGEPGPGIALPDRGRRRRRGVGRWALVMILLLALAGAGYAIFSSRGDTGTDPGVVPRVVGGGQAGVTSTSVPTMVKVPALAGLGLTSAEAEAELATYTLRATVTYLETSDYKQGLVIAQDPVAGTEVQQNSAVELTVSKKGKAHPKGP